MYQRDNQPSINNSLVGYNIETLFECGKKGLDWYHGEVKSVVNEKNRIVKSKWNKDCLAASNANCTKHKLFGRSVEKAVFADNRQPPPCGEGLGVWGGGAPAPSLRLALPSIMPLFLRKATCRLRCLAILLTSVVYALGWGEVSAAKEVGEG